MGFHEWGDDFDWQGFYKVEHQISRIMRCMGLLLISKEKYGTLRYEHVVNRLTGSFDSMISWHILWIVVRIMIKLHPNFEFELTEDIACRKEIVGKKVHDKYWHSVTDSCDKDNH